LVAKTGKVHRRHARTADGISTNDLRNTTPPTASIRVSTGVTQSSSTSATTAYLPGVKAVATSVKKSVSTSVPQTIEARIIRLRDDYQRQQHA
jgi:hypothetical protein